jgi:hypothetical protein
VVGVRPSGKSGRLAHDDRETSSLRYFRRTRSSTASTKDWGDITEWENAVPIWLKPRVTVSAPT